MTSRAKPAGPAPTGLERVAQIAIVGLAGAVALVYIAFGLVTASTTLGCDFFTYADAANRHLQSVAIYAVGSAHTGDCGLYQYPPPFLLFVLPFAALGHAGVWVWIAASIAAFATGCAILPVKPWIRLAVFLIGAVGWPFIFGLRIGQVVPLLYFLFAVGWRFLDRPAILGTVIGLGAIVKIQPGLIVLWLAARLQLRTILIALATAGAVSVLAAAIGLADWAGFVRILRDISSAIDAPVNMSIGATLYRFGLDPAAAGAIQTANVVVLVVLVIWAGRRLGPVPGYLLVVTASQIISPIVWSHYALILLLPVAWLLDRRQWWVIAIPLVHAWVLLPFVPNWTYTLAFYLTLVAIVIVGRRAASPASGPVEAGATAITGASAAPA